MANVGKIHREMITEPVVWVVLGLEVTVISALAFTAAKDQLTPTLLTLYVAVLLGLGVVMALLINFFRVPERVAPREPGAIIAPCDGKVVVIEEVMDPLVEGRSVQLSIFMSPLDVHVNYSPVAGTVERVDYHPGKYLVAWHPKSSTDNEQTRWRLRSEGGAVIGMKQIAGALARRIKWYKRAGDAVTAGAEVGFIKFGSRVDLLLPPQAQVTVKLGDRTVGGETVVARM